MEFLIFLGGSYHTLIDGTEQYLPRYLSKYSKVVCFEYPQFKKLFLILSRKIPIYEEISPRLYIYHSFGFLPFGRQFLLINKINHYLNFFILTFFFQKINLQLTKIISFTPEVGIIIKDINIIYHVLDDFYALPYWSHIFSKRQLAELEPNVVKLSKIIITISPLLYKRYKAINKNVILFNSPTNLNIYKQYIKSKQYNITPTDLLNLPQPIIGFSGGIYNHKIDYALVINLCKKFSFCSIIFLGPWIKNGDKDIKKLISQPNFHYLGYKNYNQIPYYIDNFDVCIIPYRSNKWGQSVYPVKINEYLFFGKPIVSTAIPSIEYLSKKKLIYWAKNREAFISYINKSLREKRHRKIMKKRIEEAKKNDWNIRIKDYLKIIAN